MDLHQQEVDLWEKENQGEKVPYADVAKLQPLNYTEFEVVEVVEVTKSSRMFKMRLGTSQTLGHKI